ncbi:cytochrome P450 2U1-like [Babylonia areolata]|uniref:cytochrome P450 2U1-like n=1 Tax=Babylonia areolata TaxID=304850 RepID=UPI003FD60640
MPTLDPTSLLVGGAVLLCLLWWLSTRRPQGLPPGPGPALPLLGHLHLMPKDPRAQLWTWRRQYGDVFSLYMGGKLVVVLASYSAIREALVTFADVFYDLMRSLLASHVIRRKGNTTTLTTLSTKELSAGELPSMRIVSAQRPMWKEQRKTSLKILRAMGMGKNVLAEKIQEDYSLYPGHQGPPGGARGAASTDTNECLQQLLLRYVRQTQKFVREQVREHAENYDASVESSDFIHAYLRQVYTGQEQGDTSTSETEKITTTIMWALLFLLHHPRVQDKCYQEICDTLGPRLTVDITDKVAMPCVEATGMEVQRLANVVPLSLVHGLARDVRFRGYIIPRGTVVIPGLEMALSDPDVWGDPENFRLERFIGPDGKVTKTEELIPFSLGRRVCLGESLARMELFIYLATLIQHFRFLPPEKGQLPSLEGILGITRIPKPFKIRAEIRK